MAEIAEALNFLARTSVGVPSNDEANLREFITEFFGNPSESDEDITGKNYKIIKYNY